MRAEASSKTARIGIAASLLAAIVVPSLASGHVERPSYWPDPAADRTVHPAAGGKVPKARSLGFAGIAP